MLVASVFLLGIVSALSITSILLLMTPSGFPAQQNQWCTSAGEHYIWIMDFHESGNETDKEIMKTYINETNNGDTTYPINETLTNVFATNYIWTNTSMTEWEWQWDWYNRLPLNGSIGADLLFFIIPLFYNNYMMNLYMINDSITYIVDGHVNEEMINTSMSYEETIMTMTVETTENMPYYNGEYIVDDTYLVVKYEFEFWSYDSIAVEYYHGRTQHIVECNTGIPLMQSLIFEFIDASGIDTLIFGTKTISSSVVLPQI